VVACSVASSQPAARPACGEQPAAEPASPAGRHAYLSGAQASRVSVSPRGPADGSLSRAAPGSRCAQ